MINNKKAKQMLNFSENARLDPQKLLKIYPKAIFIENKDTDTQCFIVVETIDNEKVIVIAFRGTEPKLKDWLTDLNGFHVVYPYNNVKSDIQVHKGFITAYKSVREKIHNYINKISGISKIIVCGHSLGGALATLCAVDLQYNFNYNIECYPSGNPSVGNKAFVKSYNKRVPNTLRTYLRTDIVPFLPPSWFENFTKGGYKHAGKANPIGSRNWFYGIKNWIKLNFKNDGRLSDDFANHDIDFYRRFL